jgi:hypothetical protein
LIICQLQQCRQTQLNADRDGVVVDAEEGGRQETDCDGGEGAAERDGVQGQVCVGRAAASGGRGADGGRVEADEAAEAAKDGQDRRRSGGQEADRMNVLKSCRAISSTGCSKVVVNCDLKSV